MKIIFFTSLLILFAVVSCGKKQEIRISAINPANGEPWPGLHYSITQQKTGAFSEKEKVIAEGFLDANGKAVEEVRMKNASYEVNIENPGNICYLNNASYTFSKNDGNYDLVFEMASCAYLKLKFENINCEGPGDNFKLYYLGRLVGGQGSGIVGALAKEGNGCYFYESSEYSDIPMGEIYYKWEVTRSGGTNIFYDTITLNAGEYKTYEINY